MSDAPQYGRYRVVEELGRGGMAVVYEAEDPMIGRRVALKVIQSAADLHGMDAEELQARFEREVQSAGVLTHPNIVHVYDVGTEDDAWWFAMELAGGESLQERLTGGGQLPVPDVLDWARSLADALDHSHNHGVVHRDVKPANILFTASGIPKISDFGIARVTDTDLTQDGKVLGTPSYMSPEQAAGKQIDGASDQFSLAVVLYHALTGRKPFDGKTPTSVLLQIVQETPPPPSRVNPDLPPAVDAVFARALAKQPEDRYPDCTAFVDDLHESSEALPDTVELDTAPTAVVRASDSTPTVATDPDGSSASAEDSPFADVVAHADTETTTSGDDSRHMPQVVTIVAAVLVAVALTAAFFLIRDDGPGLQSSPAGGVADSAAAGDVPSASTGPDDRATADDPDGPAAAEAPRRGSGDDPEEPARTPDPRTETTGDTADAASPGGDGAGPGDSTAPRGEVDAPGRSRFVSPPASAPTDGGAPRDGAPAEADRDGGAAPEPTGETPAPLELQITSRPSGARVLFDGDEVGTTPTTVPVQPDRTHDLRVEADGHDPASWSFSRDDLSETQRRERELFFPLESSIPPARVGVDADYAVLLEATPTGGGDAVTAGPAPDATLELSPGEYRVALSAPEVFLQRARTVSVEADQEMTLPTPAVISVTVAATPGNCRVEVNGRFVDVTPFQLSIVEGDHEFRFEWPGLDRSITRTKSVAADTTRIFETVPQ